MYFNGMSYPSKILFQSFVKPFYKENTGLFVFVYTMMFCIVGVVDGAGLLEYHYSLITGMLANWKFLLFVFFGWFLYTRKYAVFVSVTLHKPQYAFMHIFNCLGKAQQYKLFFKVELWLMLPVLLYTVIIYIIGCWQHNYTPLIYITLYLLLLCVAAAAWHVYLLLHLHQKKVLFWQKVTLFPKLLASYPMVLLRFVVRKQTVIWAGIKIYTCGVLYMIARNNSVHDTDIVPAFLFFNFGILSNGILVYRIREFEETYLMFYRGIPVSLMRRFFQYTFIYFFLLIPEFVTVGKLVPVHLNYDQAIRFALCGYSLLLLMNSITFIQNFSTKDFVKILILLFFVACIFLPSFGITVLYLFFLFLAIVTFLKSYYQFEQKV